MSLLAQLIKSVSRAFRSVGNLVFVPQCVGCGLRMGAEDADAAGEIPPLCPTCMAQYKLAKNMTCPVCNGPLNDCLCSTYYMRRHGLSRLIKLVRYEPREGDLPANRLILSMKYHGYGIVTAFLARELADVIAGHVKRIDEWTIVFAPRTAKMRRQYGFDQSERLARALGRQLHIPVMSCLWRKPSAKVQKKLNREQRLANMRGSYTVKKNILLRGKKILLLDDIVTTGATMLAAAHALRKAGAKQVIGVTVGAAYRDITPAQNRRMKKKYSVRELRR